jgi:acetyl esterase/lipase
MNKVIVILLSALIFFSGNLSGVSNNEVSDQDKKRFVENVFEKIDLQKDIIFGISVNEKQIADTLKLDIYSPKNDESKSRPVIIWFHGGGFRYGNTKTQSYIVEMANRFASKGYVCISADYRLRTKPADDYTGTISDAVDDGFKAINWVRQNSTDLRIDPNKIIIGGGSAGGMLASCLCYNDRKIGEPNEKMGIVAFVNLWGTPGTDRATLQIDKSDPPTIIVHGTADQLVEYSNSTGLVQKLDSVGVKNKLITLEGAGHTPAKQMNEYEPAIAGFLYQYIR